MRIIKSFAFIFSIWIAVSGLMVKPAKAALIEFSPSAISFDTTIVGDQRFLNLEVMFSLDAGDVVENTNINIAAGFNTNFSLSPTSFGVGTTQFTVGFTPLSAGSFTHTLRFFATELFNQCNQVECQTTERNLTFADLIVQGVADSGLPPPEQPEETPKIPEPPEVIPLPAALPLFLTGLAGLGLMRRRKRQASRD